MSLPLSGFHHILLSKDHDPQIVTKIHAPDKGIKVHPGKGGAVLFYNMLEG
jgi:hypothetical protein